MCSRTTDTVRTPRVPAVVMGTRHAMDGRKEYYMVWSKCRETQANKAAAGVPEGSAETPGSVGACQKGKGGIGRKAGHISPVLALCPMFLAMSGTVPAFASGGSPAGSVIDTGLVGELVNLVKQVAELFTIFPINVFLIGSLAGLGFALFRKAKHTAVD